MQVIADDLCIERMVLALSDGSDAQKASAARVLEQLAFHTPIRRMIGRAGAIGPLLALVKTGTEAQKCYATYTLRNLTIDCQANCSEMVKQGAIPVLVELLKSGDVCHKRNAVFALVNLSNSEEHNAVIVQHNGIEHLITLLQKGTGSEQRIYAAQVLANLSAESASHRAKIARHGAIPILGRLAFSGSNEMKSQAAVALGNLARRNAYNCVAISKTNAIEPLVTMLRGSEEQKTAAVKALELINYYSDACHAETVEQGAVPLLRALVLAGTIEQQRTVIRGVGMGAKRLKDPALLVQELHETSVARQGMAAVAVAKLAHSDAASRVELAHQGAIPPLVAMLQRKSVEAAEALGMLAIKNGDNRVEIASWGAIPLLVVMLKRDTAVQSARTLRRLIIGNKCNCKEIVANKGIPALVWMLECSKQARKEAMKTLESLASEDFEARWTELVFKEKVRACIAFIQATKGLASVPVLARLAGVNRSNLVWHIQHVTIPYYAQLLRSQDNWKKACAAECIKMLAKIDHGNIDVILQNDAIAPLVAALECSDEVRKKAVKALSIIATCDTTRIEMVRLGAIRPLFELANGGKLINTTASALLQTLTKVEQQSASAKSKSMPAQPNKRKFTKDLSLIVQDLRSPLTCLQLDAARSVVRIARSDSAIRATIAQQGAIPPLITLLSNRFKLAVTALSMLALENRDNQVEIARLGAIPHLIAMLASNASTESADALRNLAVDNEPNCLEIVTKGAIPLLASKLEINDSNKGVAAQTLEALARADCATKWETLAQKPDIQSYVAFVRATNEGELLPALSRLAGVDSSNLIGTIQSVVIPYYIKHMNASDVRKRARGAECIGKLATLGNGNINVILQLGAIKSLVEISKGPKDERKKAMTALTALVSFKSARIEMVRLEQIPLLLKLMDMLDESGLRSELPETVSSKGQTRALDCDEQSDINYLTYCANEGNVAPSGTVSAESESKQVSYEENRVNTQTIEFESAHYAQTSALTPFRPQEQVEKRKALYSSAGCTGELQEENMLSCLALFEATDGRVSLPVLSRLTGVNENNLDRIKHVIDCVQLLQEAKKAKQVNGAEGIEQLASARIENITMIVQVGALYPLIEMLKGPAQAKKAALKALTAIARCEHAQNEMERLGLTSLLLETANDGKKVKRLAANLLRVVKADNNSTAGINDGINTHDKKNQAGRQDLKSIGVTSLANSLISEIHHEHVKTSDLKTQPKRDDGTDCGPTNMRYITDSHIPDLMHLSTQAQTNVHIDTSALTSHDGHIDYDIASSTTRNVSPLRGKEEEALGVETSSNQTRDQEHCATIVQQDDVQNLVTSLQGNYESRINASKGLGNLALMSPANCVAIADRGAIPLLVRLLRGKIKQQSNAVSALSSLTVDNENNCVEIERCGAVPLLIAMLQNFRNQRCDAATILERIASHDSSNWIKFAKSKRIQSFVIAIAEFEPKLSLPVLTRLSGVTDENRAELTRTVVIPYCTGLLRGSGAQIVYALQSFENIMESDETNTQLLAQNHAIPPLISLLNTDHRRLAAKLVGLLATNSAIQSEIVKNGAIPLLEAMLNDTKRGKMQAISALNKLSTTPHVDEMSTSSPDMSMTESPACQSFNYEFEDPENQCIMEDTSGNGARRFIFLTENVKRSKVNSNNEPESEAFTTSADDDEEFDDHEYKSGFDCCDKNDNLSAAADAVGLSLSDLKHVSTDTDLETLQESEILHLIAYLNGSEDQKNYALIRLDRHCQTTSANRINDAELEAIPSLIRLLKGSQIQTQLSAKVLMSLASGNEEYQVKMVQQNAIPQLIDLLRVPVAQRDNSSVLSRKHKADEEHKDAIRNLIVLLGAAKAKIVHESDDSDE